MVVRSRISLMASSTVCHTFRCAQQSESVQAFSSSRQLTSALASSNADITIARLMSAGAFASMCPPSGPRSVVVKPCLLRVCRMWFR